MNREAFFTLHHDLPREGPGCPEDVAWACACAQVPPAARILDAGCGPGADIEALLHAAPQGSVVAVDKHAAFIDAVNARFGADTRVTARVDDMAECEGTFDFIWSAGALYFLGIAPGLRAMRRKLAPEGAIAFSHLVYTTPNPPAALRAVFDAEPEVIQREDLTLLVETAGFEIVQQRLVPETSWQNYYEPMRARVAMLRPGADADLTAVLDEADLEIKLRDDFPEAYGYVLTVARPK